MMRMTFMSLCPYKDIGREDMQLKKSKISYIDQVGTGAEVVAQDMYKANTVSTKSV